MTQQTKRKSRIVRKIMRDQLKTVRENAANGTGFLMTNIVDPWNKSIPVNLFHPTYTEDADFLPVNCLGSTLSRQEVFDAISIERDHQDRKWGVNREHGLADFLLIMKKELDEAIDGWMKNREGRNSPLNEICQVAAVAVAAMERYGSTGITIPTDDIQI